MGDVYFIFCKSRPALLNKNPDVFVGPDSPTGVQPCAAAIGCVDSLPVVSEFSQAIAARISATPASRVAQSQIETQAVPLRVR